MYKIITTDLDETLLDDNSHVSKQDIETISKLEDCKLVIATGRSFKGSEGVLKEIGQFNKKNTYLISFNGGVITENYENKVLFSHCMNYEDCVFIYNIAQKYDQSLIFYTPTGCFYNRLSHKEIYIHQRFGYSCEKLNDLEQLRKENVIKGIICYEDIDYLKDLRKKFNIDDKYTLSISSSRYLEINPLGISKGLGLTKLCEILGIDIKDTIGVGDNINDIELIKQAGLGIGVKNVYDDVRPYCDVVLNSDNNHSPITEIVNRFIK